MILRSYTFLGNGFYISYDYTKGGYGCIYDTEIKNAVNATGTDAQYDEKAKRLLGNKIILAHILVKTIDEFRGMNPNDAVSYIEGEPFMYA